MGPVAPSEPRAVLDNSFAPESIPQSAFSSARGGCDLAYLRDIDESELDSIAGLSTKWAPQRVRVLKAAHHQIASLIAQGKEDTQISLITGYTLNRISVLKADPAFKELLAHYAVSQEAATIDSFARMKLVGDHALEELLRRVDEEGDQIALRELIELVKTTHVEPMKAKAQIEAARSAGAPIPPSVNFQINLVESPNAGTAPARTLLDLAPEEAK